MARLRSNFIGGTIENSGSLGSGDTTLQSADLAGVPAVTGGDIVALILDPFATAGDPEIVHVTAHTALAATATIARQQETTTARSHAETVQWIHAPTAEDWAEIQATMDSAVATITAAVDGTDFDAKGDLLTGTAADSFDRVAVGVNDASLVADSSAPGGVKWEKLTVDGVGAALLDELAPAGMVVAFSGSTPPTGWLLGYGQAVNRTTYARLNTVYSNDSYPFGDGDGSTTFNMPDLRGRAPIGLDNMGGIDAGGISLANVLGTLGGSETASLSAAELPAHTHSGSSLATDNPGDHVHAAGSYLTATGGSHTHTPGSLSTGAGGSHTHTLPNSDHANDWPAGQVNGALGHLDSGGDSEGISFTSMSDPGSHSHTSFSGITSSHGGHTHAVVGESDNEGGHTHAVSGSTGSTGAGSAFSILPPVMAMNYIVKT